MKQKTISKSFSLSGVGIHSGQETTVTISPAAANSGIFFLKGSKKIPALAGEVRNTKRGTTLQDLAVTEHLLAAAFGLGIDNLAIEVAGDELPIMDGSALPFATSFKQVGITEQKEQKNILKVEQPIKLVDGNSSLEALPYHGFRVDFMVNFVGVGEQKLSFDSQQNSFSKEIAPARTFGYLEEYEDLKKQGLAKGASFENALVLGKDGYKTRLVSRTSWLDTKFLI